MADENLERITILLQARDKDFHRAMDRNNKLIAKLNREASRNTSQMSRNIDTNLSKASSSVMSFGKSFALGAVGGAAAALFAGVTSNVNATVQAIAQLGDEAKRSGLAVEAFQEWRFVAETNRIAVDSLIDGFKELSLRADEFILTGSGSAAEAFNRLGYTATDLTQKLKDPSELMLEIIGRLEGLDKAAQIRIADELFGGSGGERFVELLSRGEGQLRKTIERAHDLGTVLDQEMIEKADELDRRYTELGISMASMWKKTAVGMADFLRQILNIRLESDNLAASDLFRNAAQAKGLLGPEVSDALEGNSDAVKDNADAISGLLIEYEQLAGQATGLSPILRQFAGDLRRMGEDSASTALLDAALGMQRLSDELDEGKISARDFEDQMGDLISKSQDAFAAIGDIDDARFTRVIERLGGLWGALEKLRQKAGEVRSTLPGHAVEMDTGTFLTVDDVDLPGTKQAPMQTPRPRAAPQNVDFDWSGQGSTSAGGKVSGGAGKASTPRDEWQSQIESIVQETRALENEAAALLEVAGVRADYANAMEYARTRAELLTAAQTQGVKITPELEAQIDQLARAYSEAGVAASDASDRMQLIERQTDAGASAMTNLFMSITDGADGAKQALAQLLLQMAQVQMQKGAVGLFGGGSVLPALGAAVGWSSGGYTGPGPRHTPAGIVHKGEVVWSQDDIARSGGLAAVEKMRRSGERLAPAAVGNLAQAGGFGPPVVTGSTLTLTDDGKIGAMIDWKATRAGRAAVGASQQAFKATAKEKNERGV